MDNMLAVACLVGTPIWPLERGTWLICLLKYKLLHLLPWIPSNCLYRVGKSFWNRPVHKWKKNLPKRLLPMCIKLYSEHSAIGYSKIYFIWINCLNMYIPISCSQSPTSIFKQPGTLPRQNNLLLTPFLVNLPVHRFSERTWRSNC